MDWGRGFRKWVPVVLPLVIAVALAPVTQGTTRVVLIGICGAGALLYLILEGFLSPEGEDAPLPSVVHRRVIQAPESGRVIHGRIFKRCEIRGLICLAGCHVTRSKWVTGRFQEVGDIERERPAGTLTFIDCKFLKCEFAECTALGTREQVEALEAVFGLSGSA